MPASRIAIFLTFACVTCAGAYASPDTVPGVECKACHLAMPATKANLNQDAASCLAAYKDASVCKECHLKGADGELTQKKTRSK